MRLVSVELRWKGRAVRTWKKQVNEAYECRIKVKMESCEDLEKASE